MLFSMDWNIGLSSATNTDIEWPNSLESSADWITALGSKRNDLLRVLSAQTRGSARGAAKEVLVPGLGLRHTSRGVVGGPDRIDETIQPRHPLATERTNQQMFFHWSEFHFA